MGLITGAFAPYESGTSLIVTVDTGTTAVEEIAEAEGYGLDVIVTDHHECKPTLPECGVGTL